MSGTRKLRKLFTLLRSEGVSRRTSGLSGVGPPPELRMNDPCVSQLDVAGIFRLDHFPAKNSDVEGLRFFLIPHGEEMRHEEAFVCNRCIRQIHAVLPAVD